MSNFKTLAIVAALALVGASGVQAQTVTSGTTYVPMDPGAPGDFENTWTFSDIPQVPPVADDPFAGPHTKGDFFDDFFTFNVPDTEWVTYTAQANNVHGSGTQFFAAGFYILADGTVLGTTIIPDNTTAHSIAGGAFLLTSGTYELELVGEFDKNGGTYSGFFDGLPAVPEPGSWALMLAGLGAMGSLARRRNNKA